MHLMSHNWGEQSHIGNSNWCRLHSWCAKIQMLRAVLVIACMPRLFLPSQVDTMQATPKPNLQILVHA